MCTMAPNASQVYCFLSILQTGLMLAFITMSYLFYIKLIFKTNDADLLKQYILSMEMLYCVLLTLLGLSL